MPYDNILDDIKKLPGVDPDKIDEVIKIEPRNPPFLEAQEYYYKLFASFYEFEDPILNILNHDFITDFKVRAKDPQYESEAKKVNNFLQENPEILKEHIKLMNAINILGFKLSQFQFVNKEDDSFGEQ